MDRKWKIIFYKNAEGKCYVDEFLKTLSEEDVDKMEAQIEVLSKEGINSRKPQTAYLRDDIGELRIMLSRGGTRTLYFFCYRDYIVLTHTFYKRTDKVPDKEIEKALKYKQDFLNRYDKENIGEA